MSYSAQRLTCYALLSALESDMRTAMREIAGELHPQEIIPEDRLEAAQARRAKDGLKRATTLGGVLAYLDFGHIYEALRTVRAQLSAPVARGLELLKPHVGRLVAVRNRVAHVRPMEIDDTSILLDVAAAVVDAGGDSWEELTDTLRKLKDNPSYVLGLTIDFPKDDTTGPHHNLPIPDFDETGFLGRQSELRRIKKRILGPYPVVSILGDGGVGKTAIALKAAYDIVNDSTCPFEAVVWVSAKATVLTPHEIKRVSGAIETSLGLFAAAAEELGGATEDPIEELYAYLEAFKVLLILDNLETVLDATLRDFLLDLPMGSKVLLTSRIAVGVENQVPLEPLSDEESQVLLRALGQIRNVSIIKQMDQTMIERYAVKMAGHPAFIKWFVSGLQAGVRPEALVNESGLLLDFCMSNVYDYLPQEPRMVLECMQVIPGSRNQAELAYLNNLTAQSIQGALLSLLATSFIAMTHSADETFDTSYNLSEFARQYLDKHHPVPTTRRMQLKATSEQLRAWGTRLTAEVSSSPYLSTVIHVRGHGDVGVARMLKEALGLVETDPGAALSLCREAQSLSPGYYEPWRIEGLLHGRLMDISGAELAYGHAFELAPESAVLAYHYGDFLLNVAVDPRQALSFLQKAARSLPETFEILSQITWAHYSVGDFQAAIDTAGHAVTLPSMRRDEEGYSKPQN